MNGNSINIGRALSVGWEVFTRQIAVVLIAYIIYVAINSVMGSIPVVNIILPLTVGFVLQGGLAIIMLKAVKGEATTIGDLFSGFSDFAKWLGVGWLWLVIGVVCMIPLGVLVGIGSLLMNNNPMNNDFGGTAVGAGFAILAIIGGIISIVLLLIAASRWAFAWYCAADGAAAVEAFRQSAAMTEGIRSQVLLAVIVLGLVGVAGIIACGIGALVTGVVSMLALASIYLDLKSGVPAETVPPQSSQPDDLNY